MTPQRLTVAREAEAAVLAAILLRNDEIEDVRALLQPEDFDTPAYRAVYEAMLLLASEGYPLDVVTLERQLRTDDTIGLVGGLEGINRLADRYTSAHNAQHHVSVVRDASRRRALSALGGALADASGSDRQTPDDLVEEYLGRLAQLAGGGSQDYATVRDVTGMAIDHARERMKGGEGSRPITTGIDALDQAIRGGLEPGLLYVVAARPGNGKTALVVCMQLEAAARAGAPGIGVHLEMTRLQLGQRILGVCAPLGLEYVEKPTRQGQVAKMGQAFDRVADLPIAFVTERITARRARAAIRAWRRRNPDGVGTIVVDYLQLHKSERGREQTREREIAEMSAEYKGLAKDLGCAVVVCSQLNRGVEQREDKRPRLSDLRESGAIEQDADTVMLLYRPANYKPGHDIHECDVIIAKQRMGPLSTVSVRFEPYYTRFVDVEQGAGR